MAPKKKKQSKEPGGSEKDMEKRAERETQLQRQLESLTETRNNLRRTVQQLRSDNVLLRNEVDRIRMETEEFKTYMSKLMQKRHNESVALSDLRQQKLEELNKRREEMVEKHSEQVNALKNKILEKENELAQLKLESAELGDMKSLRQQQLDRIAELEQEVVSEHCHYSELLNAQKANSFREKERHKAASKVTVREFALKATKEASVSLLSHMQQESEESHRLHEELQQLIQRAQTLRCHHQLLQKQRRQLLMEKKFGQELQCLRISKAQGASAQESLIKTDSSLDNK
ncbi:coiled-coil domain-containing protein 121 [Tachysurus fulvidraco]|uniref:coiled-coil domain-containing protein 121 n=1 Tax=Tachysurus fulvidraco TaxID=1234273 RepID=UPI001FEE921B|nr:coiled-coil domain-containing protein 121 [Tachysurus fulvidraco]